MQIVKTIDQPITEELVKSLIRKFVHVPTNLHSLNTAEGEREENIWFAGEVAGFERAEVQYDYPNQVFLETPVVYYNLMLTDGMGYLLSDQVEIHEVTEEEFQQMLSEHLAKQTTADESDASVETE